MRRLRISDDLSLPAEAVTETFGLLAVRGAGKSNAARVMAEEMFRAGLPFVAVDPVGSWRGLRAARDGKGAGLAVPIFGGKWGDVPLERGGGELLADLVVGQRLSCVLDLSTMDSESAKKGFLLDFARRLYLKNEEPLHLFLEEADDYIPQRPMRDEAQLLRAWENIVRRGRARGIGCTLITQRSAALAKDVLTQVQTLIAMRTTGPQDVAAVAAWLKYHAAGEDILETLASLKAGEAWVWSPVFLAKTVRIRFRLSETFDSGATPKAGAATRAAATLADVDLGDIQKRMADTIERAKATDPKHLQARVRELERELRQAKAAQPAPAAAVKRVEVPVLKDAQVKRLERAVERAAKYGDTLLSAFHAVVNEAGLVRAALEKTSEKGGPRAHAPTVAAPAGAPPRLAVPGAGRVPASATPRRPSGNGTASAGLGAGERRVLAAIAQHGDGVTRDQLTVLTGYKRSSRDTYLQRLNASGLVMDDRGAGRIYVTAEGVKSLGPDYIPLPTGDALREHWLARLSGGERRLLELVCEAHPGAVAREALTDASGYKRSSRDTYLQRLAARRLIFVGRGGGVSASPELFG